MATKLTYVAKKRVCSCCGKEKPVSSFYMQSYTNEPQRQCKECVLIKKRVARQKARHGKFVSKERSRNMEEVDYKLDDWRAAMLHFEGLCCYCRQPEGRAKSARFDREHLIPLSRGGKTVRQNIAPACKSCNRGRGNKDLFDWFRAQSFWTQEQENKIIEWMGTTHGNKHSEIAHSDVR